MEKEYLIARSGDLRVLRRGAPLGEPPQEAAFLTRGEMVLSYPRGVSLEVRASIWREEATLKEVSLRWGEETLRFFPPAQQKEDLLFDFPPLSGTLREALRSPFQVLGLEGPSPRMEALVKELAQARDPLAAPWEGAFWRRVELRALAGL